MSMSNGETAMRDAMKNLADDATYQRLEKDVTSVKNDIAALTEQITDAINTFAGKAGKRARRGYNQARENVDSAIDDASDRGSAMLDAAQDAAVTIEETLEAGVLPTGDRVVRPKMTWRLESPNYRFVRRRGTDPS
jgi:ElaB/YqjD/DUF883 family membrane-anchored ribosome-binding protein